MYISIKYKYIVIYSILIILPIIMFHVWIYQIWSGKLYDHIVDSNVKLVKQLGNALALFSDDKKQVVLNELIAGSGLDKNSDIVVTDRSGRLIYSSNAIFSESRLTGMISSASDVSGKWITHDFKQEMLVAYHDHPVTRWHVMAFTPTEMIYDQMAPMKWLMFALIMLSVILGVSSVVLISFHLTSPIRTLKKKLEELEDGRLDPLDEPEVILKDELWKIGISFNGIVSKLSEQMNLHYQLQMKSNQAKLLALQSQINPHFLHNTLETINSIALVENVPVIAQLSRSLSKMFRYNTVQESRLVTIKEELEHVENYLNVQLIRFDGIISSETDVNAAIMEKPTIKFILQPLIENCFVHAFKDLVEQGMIRIKGCIENESIVICIEDNGRGMDSEQLIRINGMLQHSMLETEEDPDGGVGLLNVNTRIKMTFGQEYGLSCHALMPRGLSVKVTLPFGV